MATQTENHFPPPPRPLEPWNEFMSQQSKLSADALAVSDPITCFELINSSPSPRENISILRSQLGTTLPYRPDALLIGVITRKFHPIFFTKKRNSSDFCFFAIWVKDASDLVRVSFWGSSVIKRNYSRLQEGRLLVIKGYRVKDVYQQDKYNSDPHHLSPAEVIAHVTSRVECFDISSLWNFMPGNIKIKLFIKEFLDFEFFPVTLSRISLSPTPSEFTCSVVARVIYKSCHTHHNKYGDVPSLWLALYDGTLTGEEEEALGKQYLWFYLSFSFQKDLFKRINTNQLIVATDIKPIYFFHEDWSSVTGYIPMLVSTFSTQLYIIDEEDTASAWHYLREVNEQKSDILRNRGIVLSRQFRDSSPEVIPGDNMTVIFKLGNFECRISSP
ncbi:hypothetical protein LOD99_15428 [Oopsacas minuta]|uniref:Uncharacterized protein n=1 Tax=Oopsacas minuta TaxID=111878 RepID=A0AAV7KD60_9METZ|nr:hypothetical protein LOD99_15428 [Oopsacas minuta]